jgi:hypothetical protein
MRRPSIGGKDFQTSIGQGEQVQGGVIGGLLKKKSGILCVFSVEKEVNVCVKEKLVLMCEKMLFMEKMCANKEHGRKLCVTNNCSGVHGRISMTKHLDSYLK